MRMALLTFALFDLAGRKLSPRIAKLPERQLWRPHATSAGHWPGRCCHSGRRPEAIAEHWDDLLRIGGSLQGGYVSATLLVASYRRRRGSPSQSSEKQTIQDHGQVTGLSAAGWSWPPAAGGWVGGGDVACDGLGSGAGVALEGPDGGVPGPGEQHRGAGAVLGLGEKAVPEPVEGPAGAARRGRRGLRRGWPVAGEEILGLDVPDLDLPSKRGRVISKGGTTNWVHWQTGTAMLLPRLLAGRREARCS